MVQIHSPDQLLPMSQAAHSQSATYTDMNPSSLPTDFFLVVIVRATGLPWRRRRGRTHP